MTTYYGISENFTELLIIVVDMTEGEGLVSDGILALFSYGYCLLNSIPRGL